jgi:ADP-ribose pyrophosphatase
MEPKPRQKPVGASLGWRVKATRYLYRSHWFDLRQDDVTLPSSEDIVFTYVESQGFVSVVPLTSTGEVILIRVYRYTVDDWGWEVPAGGLGTKQGLSREEAAREELAEETGYVAAGELRHVGTYHSCIGNSNMQAHVYLATDVRLQLKQSLDNTEVIEVHRLPVAVAMDMVRKGEIKDVHSALALLLCEPLIAAQLEPEAPKKEQP